MNVGNVSIRAKQQDPCRKDIRVVSRQQAVRCRDGVAYIVIRELSFLYDNTPRAALLSPLLF